jgi:methylated-DNA-protein-cysteine methyltransferase-like protein
MSSWERFYDVVRRVPSGRVTTYGRVATLAGLPGQARQVGYAMAAAPEEGDVPWHRVVNARGEISRRAGGTAFERIQRVLLEAEGVAFGHGDRIDLDRFGAKLRP